MKHIELFYDLLEADKYLAARNLRVNGTPELDVVVDSSIVESSRHRGQRLQLRS